MSNPEPPEPSGPEGSSSRPGGQASPAGSGDPGAPPPPGFGSWQPPPPESDPSDPYADPPPLGPPPDPSPAGVSPDGDGVSPDGQALPEQPQPGPATGKATGDLDLESAGATRSRRGGRIAMIISLVGLFVVCGVVGAVVLGANLLGNKVEQAAPPDPSHPSPPESPAGATPSDGPRNKPGKPGKDDFQRGDCLLNDGTAGNPDLREVPCARNTLEVLARISFSIDDTQCDRDIIGAGGRHDSTYVHDASGSVADYVLCLKRR